MEENKMSAPELKHENVLLKEKLRTDPWSVSYLMTCVNTGGSAAPARCKDDHLTWLI
jgi:hypothetical protein